MKEPGPTFRIMTSAISVCGTLMPVLTDLTWKKSVAENLHLGRNVVGIVIIVAFLSSIGASLVGVLSLFARTSTARSTLATCLVAYLFPWILIVLMMTRA